MFLSRRVASCLLLTLLTAAPVAGHPHPAPTQFGEAVPEPADPCAVRAQACASPEWSVRVWIEAAFPPAEWETAYRVVVAETGGSLDPAQRTGGPCCATGLFQFTTGTWNRTIASGPSYMRMWDKAQGWSGGDRRDGWRNTLAAAWLVERDGWDRHWQVCVNYKGTDAGRVRC